MYRIEINDEQIVLRLGQLAFGMEDMTPAMQEIAEFLVVTTKERFPAGIAPDGTPWAPKSQTTLDTYARRGDRQDPRPLFGPSRALSSTIFGVSTPNTAEVGSALIYSAVMQFGAGQGAFGVNGRGGPIPWGNIPARPFLGLSETDQVGILDITAEYLDALSQGR